MSSPGSTPTVPPVYPRRPRSLFGPVLLIAIGVVFTLRNFGYLKSATIFHWFALYWPVLIIIWGLLKLLDHQRAQRAGYPTRGIGGGGVVLLIFLILGGLAVSESEKVNWGQLGNEMDIDEDVFSAFGNTYNYTADLDQAIPAGVTTLRVVSDRGDVTVNPSDDNKIKVTVRKSVTASSEADSKQYDNQTKPQISVSGDALVVNANTGGAGDKTIKSNLEIFVPRKLALDIATKRGDVAVRQRQADVKASTAHGDVSTDDITGNVVLSVRRGNVSASKVTGDLTVDGRIDNTTVSEVGGSVRFSGDFFGDMNLSGIGKSVSFKSSRTDLEFARLQGDMVMQSGELRAKGAVGPVRVVTKAKDIHLEDVTGDIRIEDSNGEVEIHASKTPLGDIQVDNRHGRVALTVPARAGFQLDARTMRGEVQSDFDIKIESSGRESHGSGSVGGGGSTVRLSTDHADIEIRKAG
jgi:DUF4097 and DUF4098 domain-containing protein YvlB